MLLDEKLFAFVKQMMSWLDVERKLSYVKMTDCNPEEKISRGKSIKRKQSFLYFIPQDGSTTKIVWTDGDKWFEVFTDVPCEYEIGIAFDKIKHLSCISDITALSVSNRTDYEMQSSPAYLVQSSDSYTIVDDVISDTLVPDRIEFMFTKSTATENLFWEAEEVLSSVAKWMKEFDTAVLKLWLLHKKCITKNFVTVEWEFETSTFRAIAKNYGVSTD